MEVATRHTSWSWNSLRIAVVLCCLCSAGFGLTTRYIGPTRTPPDFPDFISACHWLNRDTIHDDYVFLADPGTYVGTCSLRVWWDYPYTITFRPLKGAGTVTLDAGGRPHVWYMENTCCVKLDSMTLTGASGPQSKAIYLNKTGMSGLRRLCGLTITGSAQYGIYLMSQNGGDSIIGCKILNTGVGGIGLNDCGGGYWIVNNIISGWSSGTGTGYGVYLYNNGGAYVYYNTIISPTTVTYPAYCCYINNCGTVTCRNNILYNRSANNTSACYDLLYSGTISSDNNDLYKNTNKGFIGIFDRGSNSYRACSTLLGWRTRPIDKPDTHSISREPQFVNLDADLHLQAGSPCIDSAVPLDVFTTDMDGEPRDPDHPDIGADEYYPTACGEDPADARRMKHDARRTTELRIVPNPAWSAAAVSWSSSEPGPVSLRLYDATGELVKTRVSGYHHAGSSSHIMQLSALVPGIYLLELRIRNRKAGTAKLVVK